MDTSHADAQLMVDALSDDQLFRAFEHTDRNRAVAELAQGRRSEAAAPSPDAVREAEARELQAVLAAVAGRALQRCQDLHRLTMRLSWAWVASIAVVALGLWIDRRFPGTGTTIAGLAAGVSVCTLIPGVISRALEVRAADRYRTKVVETVLEWCSRQPSRLGRGADGLPRFPRKLDPINWRLFFGAGLLCLFLGAFAPLPLFVDGYISAGITSIVVVSAPLIACGVRVIRSLKRMERRLEYAGELIIALSHPSSEVRM